LKELGPSVFFGSARASMRFRTAPGRQKPTRQGLRNGRSAAAGLRRADRAIVPYRPAQVDGTFADGTIEMTRLPVAGRAYV
jgi:hypothetical protein